MQESNLVCMTPTPSEDIPHMMNPNSDDEEDLDPYTPTYYEHLTQMNSQPTIPIEIMENSPMSSISSFCNSDASATMKVPRNLLPPPTFGDDGKPLSSDLALFGHPDFLQNNMPKMKLKRRHEMFGGNTIRSVSDPGSLQTTPRKKNHQQQKTISVLKRLPSSAEKSRRNKRLEEGQNHRRVVSFPDDIIQSTTSSHSTPGKHVRTLTAESDDPALFSLLEITPTRRNGRVCIGSDVEHSPYGHSSYGLRSLSEAGEILDCRVDRDSPKTHQSRKISNGSPSGGKRSRRPLKDTNHSPQSTALTSLGTIGQTLDVIKKPGSNTHTPLQENMNNQDMLHMHKREAQVNDDAQSWKQRYQSKLSSGEEDERKSKSQKAEGINVSRFSKITAIFNYPSHVDQFCYVK